MQLYRNALQSLGVGSKSPSTDATEGAKEKTEVRLFLGFHHQLSSHACCKVDDILEKIYANMSACHLKNQNWKRAAETADKASGTSQFRISRRY